MENDSERFLGFLTKSVSSDLGYPMLPAIDIYWHTHGAYPWNFVARRRHNWSWVCLGVRIQNAYQNSKSRVCVSYIWFQRSGAMKDIERQAYFRTGRRCPQGPDLGLSKSTRGGFKVLYSSFEKTKPFFSENDLQHIAQDICFPSFTTLHVEHLFAGMRPQVVRHLEMHAYDSRRPSCNVESAQNVYHSSFSLYTGP